MIEKCKKQPLKSACWIYLALTLVPGVFLPDNAGYLTESFVRCLLPGAIACWIAVKAFGAQRSSLGVEGFWKSLLYSSPIAVLCIINLVTAKHGEIAFHQVVWASCTALGEELMARFMLFRGIALGSAGVLRDLLSVSDASKQWQDAVLQAYHTSNFVYLGELVAAAQRGQADKAQNRAQEQHQTKNAQDSQATDFKLADPALDNPGNAKPEVAQAIFALSRLRGGKQALKEVKALLAPFGCTAGIAELEGVYDALVELGLGDKLLIDFSVMSSFDYYTGLVFEAYAPGLGSPLGGGGRYDNLLASYGAEKIPAAGFAFYLEQVMAARQAAVQLAASHAEQITQEASCSRRPLRIAVPKGSLKEGAVKVLADAGLDVEGLLDSGRTLMLRNGDVEYLIVRPTDAPVFVSLGAADCGICGEDSLLEAAPDVVELVDLKFGGCRFVVAESKGTTEAVEQRYRKLGSIRVATKYPNITRSYYAKIGMPVEIVKLHGNIELAPITGMAERIVDITATGTTLRENNLVVVDDVLASTARFFANPSSFRTNPRVGQLADTLYKQAKEN